MINMIHKFFKLDENNTSIRTECLAGLTTFLTMSYIIFVNPDILQSAGMDFGAVFVATCIVTAIGSLLIGIMANYPVAIAPGMALNVYFSYVIVQALGYSWQSALGAVFISGVLFFIITITKIRRWIVESIPNNLNIAIAVGIGIFISLLALKSGGVIKANSKTFMTLSDITSTTTVLFFLGFCFIVALDHLKIPGAIIISILSVTLVSIILGVSQFHGIFAMPPSIHPTFFKFNLDDMMHFEGFSIIFAFLLVTLFDATGTLIGVLQQTKFRKDPQRVKRLSQSLLADSLTTIAGSLLGTSSTSPFVESVSGIRVGGRTGLTAIVIAILFLFSLFLSPLAKTIPSYAVAPALLYVGLLMVKSIIHLDYDDFSEYVPSIITVFMIPFSFSIADGLGFGIISYLLIKLFCGKARELNIMLIGLAIIFIIYFILKPQL